MKHWLLIGVVVCVIVQSPPLTGRPLAARQDADARRVVAVGTATVFNGNVGAARQAALQSAYAQAVAMGTGTDIGRLTILRNVQAVTDVVSSRSRGFVKGYQVVGDQLVPGAPQRYEVRINADVVAKAQSVSDELEGLRLFLDVIGSPKILVLLPDRDVTATTPNQPEPDPAGTMRAAETAVAAAFAKFGYPVSTSDDLVAGGKSSAEQLARARRGVTADAIAVARAAGADLLLTGNLRSATQKVTPSGVEFVSATTEVSAKALVVSNGYIVEAFHKTVTKAHVSAIGAVSASMDAIATDLATALAWKIPAILAARPRVTTLVVSNVNRGTAERLRTNLQKVEGIDVVRLATVPTAASRTAEIELQSGYVGVSQDELVNHCIETAGPVQVKSADKYLLTMSVL
jgi:hypothetical protein